MVSARSVGQPHRDVRGLEGLLNGASQLVRLGVIVRAVETPVDPRTARPW
jgi:hypothetical protein